MKITKIRFSLLPHGASPVCAYCTVWFDDQLAVHDLRIIRHDSRLFVAMPNRKRTKPCQKCQTSNTVLSRFCSHCGVALLRISEDPANPSRPHIDIAHPLTAEFRAEIEQEILANYQKKIDSAEGGREANVYEGA